LRVVPEWELGLGYSYEQNNLNTYMAFQNDSAVGYVVNQQLVPYKQIGQTYWGESTYTLKKRLASIYGLRITRHAAECAPT